MVKSEYRLALISNVTSNHINSTVCLVRTDHCDKVPKIHNTTAYNCNQLKSLYLPDEFLLQAEFVVSNISEPGAIDSYFASG